jgi:chemotaxis protein MotB
MASMSDAEQPHEIVIVRRRGSDDHDDHHGGVWKVAFADFMTAMMAFFLVLWIVNSTTKQTRSSLARYFNPIRLSDTTPARKGLNDAREVDFDASADGRARIERDAGIASAGEPAAALNPPAPSSSDEKRRDAAGLGAPAAQRGAGTSRGPFEDTFAVGKGEPKDVGNRSGRMGDRRSAGLDQASQILKAVKARLRADAASDMDGSLDVQEVAEGTLISLTDKADLGTFGIGSSEPEQRQLRALAAIADALKERQGTIVVRGHTDARQYRRGDGFENWRLSFARAQSALFGLVRAGLDERRIERIEGYADHKLKNATAPQAAENRRIEILLLRHPE